MATFTPYDRTIKETITVDFQDRKTLQRVEFENGLNIYKGRFIGTAQLAGNGTDTTIENYGIVDSTLSGCSFIDEEGMNVLLEDFHGETVSAISDLSVKVEELSSIVTGPISGFELETVSADQGLSSIWSAYSTGIDEEGILSALRYVFKTLGKWKTPFADQAQQEEDPVSSEDTSGHQILTPD